MALMAERDPTPFGEWVLEHGGDEQFTAVLAEHGFSSKLSLANFDLSLETFEVEELMSKLKYGQKCLLRGLVKLCRSQEEHSVHDSKEAPKKRVSYEEVSDVVERLETKGKNNSIRAKLGQLFHFDVKSSKDPETKASSSKSTGEEASSDLEDFQPVQLSRRRPKIPAARKSLFSRTAPRKGKQPAKRKVKECRLKVVVLPRMMSRIPAPSERHMQELWVRVTADEEEVTKKFRSVFGWSSSAKPQYLYAQGKSIRPASLEDVEGADSWDAESIRALMGNGFLYVVKGEIPGSDTEEDFEDMEDQLKKLQDMFQDTPRAIIDNYLRCHGFHKALNILLDEVKESLRNPPASPTLSDELPEVFLEQAPTDEQIVHATDVETATGLPVRVLELDAGPSTSSEKEGSYEHPIEIGDNCQSLEKLLQAHAAHVINRDSEYVLSVDRSSPDNLWMSAISFYKGAKVRPEKLQKQLIVNFSESGEVGADSGALRKEFFGDVLREANRRLFDGDDHCRIPKKDYTLQILFELVGMLVAHSVLQEGPGFPCMNEAVYEYIIKGECFPSKADIPLDLATTEMHAFIEKLDEAKTDDDIDTLMDKPASMFIINQSRWSVIEPVTTTNKAALLQHLIWEEVILRREGNIQAFKRGLRHLKLLELMERFPDALKAIFVAKDEVLTSESFWALIASLRPHQIDQQRAYDYFHNFIIHLEGLEDEGVSLSSLLHFITRYVIHRENPSIAPWMTSLHLHVKHPACIVILL